MKKMFDSLGKSRRNAYLHAKNIKPGQPHQLDLLFPTSVARRGDLRHIPNDYARSSLFTARNKREPRKILVREKLFHYNEYVSILYSGIELRAEDDEIICLQIFNYGQSVPLGQPFDFSIKDLVHDVNWSKNGHYYDKARECISRLKASEILALNHKAYGDSGSVSLIEKYTTVNDADGKPTKYRVWLDPDLIVLFAGGTFTSHNWGIYRELSPVARRLCDYIESHKYPNPLALETFRHMCGSNDSSLASWRQTVNRACSQVKALPTVQNAEVKGGVITVVCQHTRCDI